MTGVDQENGYVDEAQLLELDRPLALELSLVEAQALKGWLLNSTSDGSTAVEDSGVKSVLVKLGSLLDVAEAVASVRIELDRMGFQNDHLSDEEVLEFGRRVSQSSVQRLS